MTVDGKQRSCRTIPAESLNNCSTTTNFSSSNCTGGVESKYLQYIIIMQPLYVVYSWYVHVYEWLP